MNTNVKTELAAVAATQSAVDAMAVVTLSPEKYAAEVYQPFKSRLVEAIDSVRSIDYDITTTAGMATAVKCRALFRDMRVAADKERKARKEPITKIGKLLESGFDQVEERITPLEVLFDGDIQAEIERKEAEKAAKIAAEVERARKIADAIEGIREDETDAIRICRTAEAVGETLAYCLARPVTVEIFQERHAEALEIRAAVAESIRAVLAERQASEAATLAAEEARKAAEKRAADEAAAVAAQRIENERVANELAIAAKRLADQEAAQALVAKQLADKAAANLRAENEARDTQVRIQREAQEKNAMALSQIEAIRHQAFIAEVGRSPYVKGGDAASYLFVLAETRAWVIDDEQFGVMTASAQMVKDSTIVMLEQGLASYIAADHAEGLEMNGALDAAIARIEPVEKFASDDLARCNATVASLLADNLPPPESCCARDARINEGFDETPSDDEILDVYVENFGGTREQAIERLALFDAVAARAEMVPA